MSRFNCALYYTCKNIRKYYCDKCTAICYMENMKNHYEIFLSNIFEKKVESELIKDLISKSYKIINNLSNLYIYLSYYGNRIYKYENFGNSL